MTMSAQKNSKGMVVAELNCENLFDCRDDSLKEDEEFLPEGDKHWTQGKYWTKLNNIAREIVSMSNDQVPALVALCEVENDTVLHDLTRRSMLRHAKYEYVMTASNDVRGIDVALLYQPSQFRLIKTDTLHVELKDRPTRDILHVSGMTMALDTLHIFVVHAPSRRGGERQSRPNRMKVAEVLSNAIDSLCNANSSIIVMGDFNDYCDSKSLQYLAEKTGLTDVSCNVRGRYNNAGGTYSYKGEWNSLDHIFVSQTLLPHVLDCHVHDPEFLLVRDKRDEDVFVPRRSFKGPMFSKKGYSDHLPLVLQLN